MKSKWFKISLVLIILVICLCPAAWTQETGEANDDVNFNNQEKKNIFSISPAFSFAWYPYAHFFKEESTKTEVDLNNFGLSVIMNLKLFNTVGANLNLKIDDPTFKKLVDVAGYVTASYFMIKFDYHSFGGTVKWTGNTPNPIPGEVYNFRNQWTYVSLLFRIDQLKINSLFMQGLLHELFLSGGGNLGAIGIGYARFDMPLEYRVRSNSGLSNPGFGLVKGEAWGFSILWDTLSWNMERPPSRGEGIIGLIRYLWIYLDWFHGLIIFGETDAQAIAWMNNANGVPVSGNIKPSYAIVKANLGLQFVWKAGEKGRIGFAVGVEILEETIEASNNDIDIYFWSRHIGPAVRVSGRW
jgi:hypothetical protein